MVNLEFFGISILAILAASLSSCDSSYGEAQDNVAATVNGEQIAVHQIQPAGQTPPSAAPGSAELAALDKLIDQELLAQKASALRLDRDPGVVREIAAARQRILVDRYVERSMTPAQVNQDEILDFYRENLALFEQRRSYRLSELVVTLGPENSRLFKAKAAGSSRLDELAEWLLNRKLPFTRINSIKFSEQLPHAVLPRIAALKEAQIAVLEAPGSTDTLSAIQVLQAQDAPLSLEEARPFIGGVLLEQKRQRFVQSRARQLRESARIEYLGSFAEAKHAPMQLAAGKQPTGTRRDTPFFKVQSDPL